MRSPVRGWVELAGALLLLVPATSRALEKPSPAEMQQYLKDGSLPERIEQARALGNHRARPELVRDAAYRLKLQHEKQGPASTPPPAWEGMPTTGTVRTFALLIAFADQPPANSTATMDARLFGDGQGGGYPYESLRNYYRRSSYGRLELQGTTLGWYTAPYPRGGVQDRESLIREALSSLDGGHDFSQYDNDGDGVIDYFLVFWTGPDTGWGRFWWAYQARFGDADYRIDGKRLRDYSWQWEARPAGGAFEPSYSIHETGHALGLPDYYDYDWGRGPAGGLGGLDMMDATRGDHNCFSKFLLGWISPQLVVSGAAQVSLRPSGLAEDAVVFARGATGEVLSEYFMVQNRTRIGNDTGLPGDGLLVWHVDARLDVNGTDFQSDNSYTAHKLLRLMEADGKEELERIDAWWYADAGDYYVAPSSITHFTRPGTALYDGTPSFMQLVGISAAGDPMTARIEEVWDATAPLGAPSAPLDDGDTTSLDRLRFRWTAGSAGDPESGIAGYQLQVGTGPAGADVYDGFVGNVTAWSLLNVAPGRTYYARVRALDGAGLTTAWSESSDGIVVSWPEFPCAALDECRLAFQTGGDAGWVVDDVYVEHGTTAARSGAIGVGETSSLQAVVSGPGRLAFRWGLAAAGCRLSVSVDGGETRQLTEAGPGPGPNWTSAVLTVPVARHVVRWTFSATSAACASPGFVDQVEWASDPGQGGIAGRVTDQATGAGVAGVSVYFYSHLYFAGWTVTDASGRYFGPPLPPGTYFARTANVLGFTEQMYSNRPCSGGSCDPISGTPIPVTASATTDGVDFSLERGGRIAGIVTDAQSGRPVAGARVLFSDGSGATVASAAADPAGGYITEPLAPGPYNVRTAVYGLYRDELYDDVPCPNGGCSRFSGKLVEAVAGAVTSRIHFALSGYGAIAGRVLAAGDSAPIAGAEVRLYDASGALFRSALTDAAGAFRSWWTVPAGTYYAVAWAPGFAEQLFDSLTCRRGACAVTGGQPITIGTGMTSQADFALDRPPLGFYTVAPCRLLDTRAAQGLPGGEPLRGGVASSFAVAGLCGVPATARAVTLNVTVTEPTTSGYVAVFAGQQPPLASVVNFERGQTRASSTFAVLDTTGALGVLSGQPPSTGTVHLVVDVTGYFE